MEWMKAFGKRHKRVSVIIIIIAALVVTYPVWPSFVRCQVVRLKLAAYLQYQEITHSENDSDYVIPDANGFTSNCYFENKNTLHALKKIVLSSRIDDATGHQLQPWPLPIYYVGKIEVGGYGGLVYHELFHFYILYPSINESNKLHNYVDQIMKNGEMSGMH